jgi:hypothetical protein
MLDSRPVNSLIKCPIGLTDMPKHLSRIVIRRMRVRIMKVFGRSRIDTVERRGGKCRSFEVVFRYRRCRTSLHHDMQSTVHRPSRWEYRRSRQTHRVSWSCFAQKATLAWPCNPISMSPELQVTEALLDSMLTPVSAELSCAWAHDVVRWWNILLFAPTLKLLMTIANMTRVAADPRTAPHQALTAGPDDGIP